MTTSPAQGQPQADDGFFPAGLAYQQYRHFIRNHDSPPEKLDIPGVDQSKHGMYKSYPYYTFVEDDGQKYIVSDGLLLGRLTLIPGPRFRDHKDGTSKWLVAKYRVDILRGESGMTPSPGVTTLSFNDPACGEVEGFLITKTDAQGKDISETDLFPDLPSGNNSLSCYRLKVPTPDAAPDPNIQPWHSQFTSQDHYEPLSYLTASWSVKDLKYIDYQHQDSDRSPLFALPDEIDPASRNWWKATGGLSMPWGWFYDQTDYSSDDTISTMISTSRDLMNALKRTNGFNVSGSVDVSYGLVSAEASFSYNSTDSKMQELNSMNAAKTAFTQSQYSHTEYAVVVNKIDLPLTDMFKAAIGSLLVDLGDGTLSDQVLKDFLDDWGTHYAYAVTYGSQGTGTHSLSEDQMSEMVKKGINYSQAWQANATVKVMGSGGSIGGGSSNETDQQMQNAFASIAQDSQDHYICTGGASCGRGQPTGDPKVPVYLDLRPISQLLGPPFFQDPKIVLELRDRVHDAIKDYAFVKLPEDSPTYGIFELTFQPPGHRDEGITNAEVEVTWGDISISVDSGSSLIPKANMQPSATDPSAFTLNFSAGLPTAVLSTHGNTITLTGTCRISSYTITSTDGKGPYSSAHFDPPNEPSLPYVPITISIQPSPSSVMLVGQPNQGGWEFSPVLQLTIEPANLSSLLGVSK